MSKTITLLATMLISLQMTGCSTMRNYIFDPVEPASPVITMMYNFVQPRRPELAPVIANKLNQTANTQNRFDYYSASGYQCRTLSLSSLHSACNINGEWRELAPILNQKQP